VGERVETTAEPRAIDNQKKNMAFGGQEFWESWYQTNVSEETPPVEWYESPSAVLSLLRRHSVSSSSVSSEEATADLGLRETKSSSKALVLGCGNSLLGEALHSEAGYSEVREEEKEDLFDDR